MFNLFNKGDGTAYFDNDNILPKTKQLDTPPQIDIEAGLNDEVSESEYLDEEDLALLEHIDNISIHPIYNTFVDAPRLEKNYREQRLQASGHLLRWVSGLLLLCFTVDCVALVYRWPTSYVSLYIALCSLVCFQLLVFICRNRYYSHMLIHYYQSATTALGVCAFAYVVLSDTISSCVIFPDNNNQICSKGGDIGLHPEDSTRVAYGMSLLQGILPFCFRVSFVYCAIMYLSALLTHLVLRALALALLSLPGSGFNLIDSVLVDALFLVTIMTIMLYGAYVYERNDRIVFLRMYRSNLESNHLQSELRMVREELTWAEDEANTNELKLEIERAKSDLDRQHPGAQLQLESWVIPFEHLAIDKRLGEGSCGEVYRGRIRENEGLREPDSSLSGGSWTGENNAARGLYMSNVLSPVTQLVSPNQHGFSGYDYTINPTPPHGYEHSRKYSSLHSSVAVKRIPKHKVTRKAVLSLLQETFIMSKCRHPNVLGLIGLVYDPYVCVVFEYMGLGSLKDILVQAQAPWPDLPGKFHLKNETSSSSLPRWKETEHSPREKVNKEQKQKQQLLNELFDFQYNDQAPQGAVWTHTKTRMCVNVAAGVSYLHSKNILHRDLKSSNLMIDSTHAVKVADLGTATEWSTEDSESSNKSMSSISGQARRLSRVGSPLWIAPEVISSEGQYNEKCDVWSFGVILCELMTHRDPYTDSLGNSHFNLLDVVDKKQNPVNYVVANPYSTAPPAAILRLAKDCCKFEPSERCSMKEALFRLLQIVVQQETSKVEAEAIAAAGPYIRYSQPSRRNIFKRHGSSSAPEYDNRDFIAVDRRPSLCFAEEELDVDDDVGSVGSLGDSDASDLEDARTESKKSTASSSADTYMQENDTFRLESPHQNSEESRPLKQCFSTHTLGETLGSEKAQSLLSSYPSMGCMVQQESFSSVESETSSFSGSVKKKTRGHARNKSVPLELVMPSKQTDT